MPYQKTPAINMSQIGFVPDVPSNATPPNAWSDCLNMRARDGSVQGVNKFEDSFAINDEYNGASIDAKPIAVTQWTPAGSSFLNIAYIIESQKTGEVGKGRVFVYNTSTQVTAEITNATVNDAFTIDANYPPQLFIFNEVLIVNPGTGTPQHITADATTNGNLADLPGWEAAFPDQYATVMRPFGNRLIAMNFRKGHRTATTADDYEYPVLFAWSNPVALIGSLADDTSTSPDTSGAQWQVSTTNSAGFNFLTSTPGPILDGFQLGEEFIAFKSDSVVRIIPTGSTFAFQSMFEDDGIFSTRCVANLGNSQQLVMGNYGVYVHDGRGDKQDIAKGSFQDTLFNSIKAADKDRTFIFHQTRDKEVWICFSSESNSGAGCNRAFVYDYNANILHQRTLPNVTDIFETELNGQLRIFATQPGTKQIQELGVTTIEPFGFITIEAKSFTDPAETLNITELLINSENSVLVSIFADYHINTDKTFPGDSTFNPDTDYKVNTRVNGKYFSIRFKMDNGVSPNLTSLALKIKKAGSR